jgi:hypothetical protein
MQRAMAGRDLIASGFNRCLLDVLAAAMPDNCFRNPTNLYPNIVSVNMLCLPRERKQDVPALRS